MPIDKKITDLTVADTIDGNDVSILARSGNDYQFQITSLLSYLENNIQTGANITFGNVLPQNTGGANGDIFINVTDDYIAQKISGTWIVKYAFQQSSGNAILFDIGTPVSDTGSDNDTYVNTATGIFYKKINSAWQQVFSMQTGPAGPQGPKGDTGAVGANGNGILNGTTNPSNVSTGTDGDFYINTINNTFFGPKTNGDWGEAVELTIDTSDFATTDQLQAVKTALVVHPQYIAPTASLSSSQNTGNYEIGQSVGVTINLAFNQHDGGTATSSSISKNSTSVATGTNSAIWTETLVISATSPSYQGSVTYAAGAEKTNNFGDLDTTGQIGAGSVTSNVLNNFKGYYKIFYGSVASAVSDSAGVRGLTNNQLTSQGNSFTINTGSTNRIFQFWLPTGKILVSVIDQDALNAPVTYSGISLSVNDAGGNPVAGTLYTLGNAIPYSSNHRHLVTIN